MFALFLFAGPQLADALGGGPPGVTFESPAVTAASSAPCDWLSADLAPLRELRPLLLPVVEVSLLTENYKDGQVVTNRSLKL